MGHNPVAVTTTRANPVLKTLLSCSIGSNNETYSSCSSITFSHSLTALWEKKSDFVTNLHSLLVSAERLFLLFENINRAVYMWQVKGLFLMRQNILHLRIEYTCWQRDLSIDSTKEPLALEGLQLNCHGSSPSSPPNRPLHCGSKTAQMRQKWVFLYVVNLKESMT